MPDDANLRSIHARIAALARSATTPGHEISAPGRAAVLKRYQTGEHGDTCQAGCPKMAPIDPLLPTAERERQLRARISGHMTRLALRSRTARAKARRLYVAARETERQLDNELAGLEADTG